MCRPWQRNNKNTPQSEQLQSVAIVCTLKAIKKVLFSPILTNLSQIRTNVPNAEGAIVNVPRNSRDAE